MIDASELSAWGHGLTVAAARVPAASAVVASTAAHQAEARAQANAPVLTGELVHSIHAVQVGLSAWEVRADSDHAGYVEEGTSVMPPEPYMGPAADSVTPGLEAGAAGVVVKALP